VYVDPDIVLDLKGSAFMIDGNDHDMSGNLVGLPPKAGLTTSEGSTPGENQTILLSQIPSSTYDQVIGVGGSPSVTESTGVDVNAMFDAWSDIKTHEWAPGSYTDATFGSINDMQVTYVAGDLHLTGSGIGSGVLLVDGSLTLTGEFTYHGLVIVRGDVRLAGGGARKLIYGTMMVGQSVTAVDGEDVTVSGTADILYCSEILDRLSSLDPGEYVAVYYEER
jgi:hypothetical protein